MCPAEMASYGIIYFPSFINTDKGIQAILRFFLRNLKRVNVGITDERTMSYTPLKSDLMA
jgi:hypothetical protein